MYTAHEVQAMLDVSASGWWRCRACSATGPGVVENLKQWKCATVLPDAEPCPGKAVNEEPSLWWEGFIRLAYTAGLRLGELLNLQWGDLDLEAGRVAVQRKQGGTVRVGDRVVPTLAWTAKDYEARSMPIPPDTVAALLRLKAQSGGSPYVFLSLERLEQVAEHLAANGGRLDCNYPLVRHLHPRFYRLQAAAAAWLAQRLPKAPQWERRTIHDLRRSYGTVMARHVPMHDLKALMGHSTIRTTEMFYLAAGDVSDKVRAAFGAAVAAG